MKTSRTAVTLAIVLLGGWAWAGSEDTNQSPPVMRLELDLADGSHIIGIPKIETLPLQTAYARMEVPLKHIMSVKLADDHETASLDLLNGDKLKGLITLKPLELTTVFGPVKIGVEHLREIVVMSSGEGLPAALRRGLILYYTFDKDEGDKVTDKGAKGHDGKVNGARWMPKGQYGGAYTFNGTCDYIGLGKSPALNFAKDRDYSLCAWILLNATSGNRPILAKQTANPQEDGYPPVFTFRISDGRLVYYIHDQGFWESIESPDKLSTGQWYHVAVTHKGSTATLYTNGRPSRTGTLSRIPSDRSDLSVNVGVGAAQTPGTGTEGEWFSGAIDEVCIYERALSADEVKILYEARK